MVLLLGGRRAGLLRAYDLRGKPGSARGRRRRLHHVHARRRRISGPIWMGERAVRASHSATVAEERLVRSGIDTAGSCPPAEGRLRTDVFRTISHGASMAYPQDSDGRHYMTRTPVSADPS